jgi:L-threonylcarbamoyladenylate synthase
MHDDIKASLEVLQKGGVILYPSDTCWAIGCDALNEAALERIYSIKKSDRNGMVLLLENTALIDRYIEDMPEIAYDLIELSEKPMTLIVEGVRNVAKSLIADNGTIGIRVTSEKFSSELIRRFKRPIIFSEAAFSGNKTPELFSEIDPSISETVDYVVKFRQEEQHRPVQSSIIKLGRHGEISIIRP